MMMMCKSKSHYTSLRVLLSPLTDNCIGLWRYENDSPVLVPFFMARPDMIFERTGANTLDFLWCPFVSHEARRSWDYEIGKWKKREKKLMLISREEWRRREQNQISFMRIFTGPLLSFLFILFFQKGENDEASFTIKRDDRSCKDGWVEKRWTEMTSFSHYH